MDKTNNDMLVIQVGELIDGISSESKEYKYSN